MTGDKAETDGRRKAQKPARGDGTLPEIPPGDHVSLLCPTHHARPVFPAGYFRAHISVSPGGTLADMNLIPVGDRVICRRSEPDQRTDQGVLLPKLDPEPRVELQVVAAKKSTGLRPGDCVVVDRYAGEDIPGDTRMIAITPGDVICAWTPAGPE